MNNEIMIKESDYNLNSGFFWVVTEDDLTIQCCLNQENGEFKQEVVKSNLGVDFGLCFDSNERAFDKYGAESCIDDLLSHAVLNEIEVI